MNFIKRSNRFLQNVIKLFYDVVRQNTESLMNSLASRGSSQFAKQTSSLTITKTKLSERNENNLMVPRDRMQERISRFVAWQPVNRRGGLIQFAFNQYANYAMNIQNKRFAGSSSCCVRRFATMHVSFVLSLVPCDLLYFAAFLLR